MPLPYVYLFSVKGYFLMEIKFSNVAFSLNSTKGVAHYEKWLQKARFAKIYTNK